MDNCCECSSWLRDVFHTNAARSSVVRGGDLPYMSSNLESSPAMEEYGEWFMPQRYKIDQKTVLCQKSILYIHQLFIFIIYIEFESYIGHGDTFICKMEVNP